MNNPKVLCVLYKDLIFSDCLYSLFVLTLNGSIGLSWMARRLPLKHVGTKWQWKSGILLLLQLKLMQKCGDMLEVGQNHRVAAFGSKAHAQGWPL